MITRRKFMFGVGLVGYLLTNLPMVVASTADYYLLPKNEVPHCHEPTGQLVKKTLPAKPVSKEKQTSNYKWIRSLNAGELRVFLKTFKAPPAYVEGMTFTYHLTNHHNFKLSNIRGLTENELFKLHSAAHYGY